MTFHVRLLVGSLMPTAGSHIYNRELIRRLAARGHRVSVVAFDNGNSTWDDVDLQIIPRFNWQKLPLVWRWSSNLFAFDYACRLPSMKLSRPDVVIGAEHLLLQPHARHFAGVPWLYLPHSNVAAREIESYGLYGLHRHNTVRLYHNIQRWALKHASRVVRFNHHSRSTLVAFHGEDSIDASFLINPQGVDFPEANRPHRMWPSNEPIRLLFLGRIVPSKNLSFVLQTLAHEPLRNWTLDVVGDGPDRSACVELSRQLGLTDYVRFHGNQSNVSEWYRNSDLFVFPTKLECAPLVLTEAMAHGLPSLVIREHGEHYRVPFAETIDGTNGLLADNEPHFQQLLSRVLRDPHQLESLALNAAEFARQHFSWERHLTRFEETFEDIVSGAATRSPTRLARPCVEVG